MTIKYLRRIKFYPATSDTNELFGLRVGPANSMKIFINNVRRFGYLVVIDWLGFTKV